MKVFNLPRGSGKSMRMIFASEFNNAPILCVNAETKNHLLHLAKKFDVKIPEPITVKEYIMGYTNGKRYTKILVDEPIYVLQNLFAVNNNLEMIGCAMSDEENEKAVKEFE